MLGPILDHIFGPKKDKLFWPEFVFRRGMSNAICDLVLYLRSEGLSISQICPGTIPFQYLKSVFAIRILLCQKPEASLFFLSAIDRYEISEENLGKSEYICFELFDVWVLNLSLKEETIKNIHDQNVVELAHYIIVFYTQGLDTCFGDTEIIV